MLRGTGRTGPRVAGRAPGRRRERYEAVLDGMPDAVFIAPLQGKVAYANPAAEPLTGWPRAALRDLGIRDLAAGPRELEAFAELARTGRPILRALHLRHRDGSLVPVEVHASRLPDGGAFAVLRDLRERLAAQQSIQRLQSDLEHTLEAVPSGVLMTTFQQGRPVVTLANRRFCELFGLEPGLVLGLEEEALRARVTPQLEDLYGRAVVDLDAGRLAGIHAERVVVTGPPRRVLQRFSGPVQEEHGVIVGRIRVYTDVTEAEALEEQLRHAQKMESVGTLGGGSRTISTTSSPASWAMSRCSRRGCPRTARSAGWPPTSSAGPNVRPT